MARTIDGPTLTRVPGVRVGHAAEPQGRSGVTAIVFDRAAPTAVDVRGGASCTYDTASLAVDATFGRRWALFFAGGSVFGLDAARGVRLAVLAAGGGHRAFGNPHPIAPVSGATLFDLPRRRGPLPDYLPLGFEAARIASTEPVSEGPVGAGAGATVGKYRGREFAMPGGIGSAASRLPGNRWVGALAVLNAVGAVRDPASGRWIAGSRGPDDRIIPPDPKSIRRGRHVAPSRGTTLVAVATDAPVDRRALQRVAVGAHTGLSRAVVPVHTATDGDVVFAAGCGPERGPTRERYPGATGDAIGILAGELVVEAVLRAARAAAR